MDYKEYLNKGIEETNKGEFDNALNSLDKAIELEANDALCYFSRAIVHHSKNDIKSAHKDYSKAIELKPDMIDAYFNRAQAILSDKENLTNEILNDALQDFEKALEYDEKFLDAYYYKAVVLMKLERYSDAVEALDTAISIDNMAVYAKALKKLIMTKYLK